MVMKKISYILFLGCILTLVSCESFLDRTPIAQIGSSDYFTSESALINYTNGFLVDYVPNAATLAHGDEFSDIIATSHSTTFLTAPQWTASLQDGWDTSDWNPIYNINYFLVHFREVPDLSEEAYNHYEGTARFWRAWKYWDFVKTFGAVPWYDYPIDPEDEESLYKGRDNREDVMAKVLEDLNFACENLYSTGEWVNCQRVSKYVALALKARICLFEGTYRKYHSVDPSTGQAWKDASGSTTFLNECVNACKELMDSGVYKLVDDGTEEGRKTQYRKLFTSEAIDYTEIIWAREYSTAMNVLHSLTWNFTSPTYGEQWSPVQTLVQTYLHLDGSRHKEYLEKQGNGETVTTQEFADEVSDRDYRLSQSVLTPGYTRIVSGVETLYSQNMVVTLTGYQTIKWILDSSEYDTTNNSNNSLPIFRYAEVLLNYAEAMAELGQFSESVWNQTIKPLRERAGVDGSYRTDIDQDLADYYSLTNSDLVEIRRERTIEMLLENIRYDDLMRWHLGELLNNTWYGIYIPEMYEPYDLDGNGTIDICVVNDSSEITDNSYNYIILNESTHSLENGDNGRLVWNVDRYFDEQRYLHPIPKTALDINPNLGQNYYWQ